MNMYDFCVIFMRNKNGKKMYLKCGKGNSMDWDFSRNEGCWFDTEKQAIEFANKYFKNFTKWQIEKFEYSI